MDLARIGHPRSPRDKENNQSLHIFSVPTDAHYQATGFVQTVVTRCGNNRYKLAFQVEGETVALIAQRKITSMTSNYRIFDALRGGENSKLSKKAGHYIGKLRRDKVSCYTLYDSSREKRQLAAFVYDIPSLVSQVKEGQPPRKMQAVIPKCSPQQGGEGQHSNRLMEHLHNGTWQHHNLVAVQTRPPSWNEGQYQLNFQGRVKNMQLENQMGQTFLQFGKVDDARFHLDFKAPFTALSAFAAALTQFDL
eukprot:scaffold22492_cov138-Skeletonema_menzelii.AAC.3